MRTHNLEVKTIRHRWYLGRRMPGSEHFRAETRRRISLPVRFRTGKALEQRGQTVDLGVGGAFIACKRPPSIGTHVAVELSSPTAWDPLSIECKVCWVDEGVREAEGPRGFGVRFEDLSPSAASALYDFVLSLDFEVGA